MSDYCPNSNRIKLCSDGDCQICFNKSFASHEKSKYWSDDNITIPRLVFKSAGGKYQFDCSCGHFFTSSLDHISKANWCPYCANQKLCNDDNCEVCYEKSFASHEKSKYWSELNDTFPRNVFKQSNKKFIFKCTCTHIYYATLSHMYKHYQCCPYCINHKLCDNSECKQCYAKSFASHEKSVYWSDNNIEKPREVIMTCKKKFEFLCDCEHYFVSPLYNIISDQWCPYCANKKLCNDEKCKQCYENSFASIPESKYWSLTNNEKPRNVFKSSGKFYDFLCECQHIFNIALCSVTAGIWCPYCVNTKLCDDLNCKTCFDKSFASHEKSKYWSQNNELTARQVFKGSGKYFEFICDCQHSFIAQIKSINHDSWCPYCANRKLCDDNNCMICFEKSFASNDKASYWSKINNIEPREVFKYCASKYKFDCPSCKQIYEGNLNNISKGHWCSCTVNKTETKLNEFLIDNYNTQIEHLKSFPWCKIERCLVFDFYLKDLDLIIELDGNQHFNQVRNWKSPEKTQEIDKYKMDQAIKHNISVIRIFQEDVWSDKNDWQNKLKEAIKKYDEPVRIYIGTIYDTSGYKDKM